MHSNNKPEVPFVTRSERDIARWLDFYGVRWEYEPRSFPLEWDALGQMKRSFTPDFYLPDYNLYLEITTMKPTLASRKHKKIRLLKEIYPDVRIKLLSLRDVQALTKKFAGRRIKGDDGGLETEMPEQ